MACDVRSGLQLLMSALLLSFTALLAYRREAVPCPAGGSHSNVLLFLSCCLFLLAVSSRFSTIWIRKTKAVSDLFSSSVVLMERSVFKHLTGAWAQWPNACLLCTDPRFDPHPTKVIE